jgi:hypothetical protein
MFLRSPTAVFPETVNRLPNQLTSQPATQSIQRTVGRLHSAGSVAISIRKGAEGRAFAGFRAPGRQTQALAMWDNPRLI